MFDITLSDRRKEIGKRIATERKKARLTQDEFADKLNKITGSRPNQSTISMWEHGESFPDNIETIFAMSMIFCCDCGYLLCDYNEKTHDATEMCKTTGLSEGSINTLCNLRVWGAEKELTFVIDTLIYDFNQATKGESIAPLIYLINWFLKYKGSERVDKQVLIDGKIIDSHDPNGYLANSLKLNDRIIENAALTEIQQGLISLKKRIIRKGRGENGQH